MNSIQKNRNANMYTAQVGIPMFTSDAFIPVITASDVFIPVMLAVCSIAGYIVVWTGDSQSSWYCYK